VTDKNHARRVSVTRLSKSAPQETAESSSARKVVAVRLRSGDSPAETAPEKIRPVDVIGMEQAEPTAEPSRQEETPLESSAAEEPLPEEIVPAEVEEETEPEADQPESISEGENQLPEEVVSAPAEEQAEPEDTPSEILDRNVSQPAEETVPIEADGDIQPETETSEPDETPEEPSAETEDQPLAEVLPEQAEEETEPAEKAQPVTDSSGDDNSIPASAADCQPESVGEEVPAEPADIPPDFFAGDEPATDDTYEEPSPAGKWYIPQNWKDITILRKLIMAASVVLALFSILPLFVGVLSPGILPPLCIAAFFFICALYWPLIDGCESTWGNVVIAVVAVCVMAGITYLSFVSGKMISASANTLREDRSDVTVVVLGCKVNGDQPSRMLKARLDTALTFLLDHPQAHCIVTGGKGADEEFHEAFVMKKYLVEKGVSPMRIIMEDASTSTLENINYSAELAEEYNCHERFLIVTDRFHQYRAMSAANDLGIVTYALNVETVWYLAMPYWFREMAAITRDWLTA